MKKKIYFHFLFFTFLCVSMLSAQSNSVVSIFDKLSTIETHYFDIIFPQESELTAEYLAMHADNLYLKAAEFLGVENLVRIPVVITQRTDVLNAYFVGLPYSRIVLYDTVAGDSLSVFDDTILSVFYHELIHAVSFKNNLTGNFFHDSISPIFTMADMPTSISEGVAVLGESLDGYGRLNSSYSTHVIRQAKIENKFPNWKDVSGSYSLYTDGSLPYMFGGAFTEYLYNTYGIEKLRAFWRDTSKVNLTSYVRSFKNVYNISIDDAWAAFEDSVEVPVLDKTATDFFEGKKGKYTYQYITSSPYGIAWQDYYSKNVYYLDFNDENQKEKFLFSTDLHSRLSFSKDGNYLVVSGERGYANEVNSARVYDMQKRRFIRTQKNIRDATIFDLSKVSGNPFESINTALVGVETESQLSYLVAYDVYEKKSTNPFIKIPFEYGSIVYGPVDIGNGKVAALVSNYGLWEFFVYNFVTGEKRTYKASEEIQPTDIASVYATDSRLFMSLSKTAKSQSTLAWVSLDDFFQDTLTVHIDTSQQSGGVFSPVAIPSEDCQYSYCDIAYISRFYEERNLSKMSIKNSIFETVQFHRYDVKPSGSNANLSTLEFEKKQYNPFKYVFDGVFVPIIGSVNLSSLNKDFITGFSLGASMYFVDPVERLLWGGGAGYDVFKKTTTATVSTLFTDQDFTFTFDGYIEAGNSNIETGATKMYVDLSVPIVSDYNRLGISNSAEWVYLNEENDSYSAGSTVDNGLAVYFSRIRKTGPSYYERTGFLALHQFHLTKYFGDDTTKNHDLFLGDIIKLEVYLPWLIPIKNPSSFTLNMPFSIAAIKYFGFFSNWKVEANAVLFSYELQKPLSFLLFFQRITLDAGVVFVYNKDFSYELEVQSSLYTSSALNFSLAAGYPFDIGLNLLWNPLVKGSESIGVGLKFGLNF